MAEIKIVRKWVWVWDFEKEEQWLNEMAMQGWALKSIGFCKYTFEKTEPGEYTVKFELNTPDDNYLSFLSETGVEYLGNMIAWAYYRKKSELGGFELFSDIDSKIQHLNKVAKMLGVVGALNIVIGVLNSVYPDRYGWINLLVSGLVLYALGRIHGKKEALEKERTLRE